MKISSLSAVLLGLAATVIADGAPLPPMKPVTVEGVIRRLQWSPETKIAGRPGFSGSLGRDRVVPAHFRITLVEYRGVESDEAWRINGIMSDPGVSEADRNQPPAHVILQLNDDDPHALMPGMRIRVKGYVVSGDEGGTWTRFQSLEVLRRPDADAPKK